MDEVGTAGGPVTPRFQLFGGLRIDADPDTVVSVPGGRARSLLAFLLLHPGVSHGRERLSDALWPDDEPARASRQLIDAIYRLRQGLPDGIIVADRTAVRLEPRAVGSVDAWAFEALIRDGSTDSLRRAADLYEGELLPDVYDDWIAGPRTRLADAYRAALSALAEDAETSGSLVDAFAFYHRLTRADPLDESGHRGLMRAYLRAGHPAAAAQQYERLSVLLRAELGIAPSAETQAILESVRREVETAESAPRPFVGRRRDRAAILERIDRATTGHLEVVVVEGAPGIGKSRLLEVIAEDTSWRGLTVAWARVDDAISRSPYAPLDTALSSVLTAGSLARLRRSLTPAALDAVAGLLPGIAWARAPGELPVTERPNVGVGLGALFRELTETRPWLLLLDDVHLASAEFWEAMSFLEAADDIALAVVLAGRREELRRDRRAWDGLRRIDRVLAPHRVTLEGIDIGESRALAAALGRRIGEDDLADLHRISGGNPLHLQQALSSGARPAGRPGFVELLDQRLATLTPGARRALESAAVLGPAFTLAEWSAVAPDSPMQALDEVIDARLVTELRDRYALEHDLTREHVYDSIEPARRRELHRRAVIALRREQTPPAVLAGHQERAGMPAEAVASHRRAAEEAFERYAYAEALDHADRALALDPVPAERGPLLSIRHRILGLQLRMDDWRQALDAAEQFAVETDDRSALIDVLEGRLSLHTLDGDLGAMESVGSRAVALSAELRDQAAEARVLSTLGWHISESLGDNQRALPMLRHAARLAAEAGDDPTRVGTLCMLSSAQRSVGRCKAAYVSASRAMTLVATRPQLYRGRARALTELAETALELGRWQEARAAMEQALAGYRELDDPWSYGSALFGLVNICTGMGLPAEAAAAAEELVELGRRLGLAAASDYGVWHRVALGRASLAGNDVDGAERAIAEVRDAVPGAARPRMALASLVGQIALARDQAAVATKALGGAFEVWTGRGEPRDVPVPLWTAVAAARAGREELARTAFHAARQALSRTDIERHDVLLELARHEAEAAPGALRAARAAIARQAARFTDTALRAAFEQDVPTHDRVERLVSELVPGGTTILRIPKAGVPLGRPIRDDEWVELRWVRDERPSGPSGQGAGVAHRRRQLQRLLEDAGAAGAAPTDEHLAAALGVSRRTILRDVEALRAAKVSVTTRRRTS